MLSLLTPVVNRRGKPKGPTVCRVRPDGLGRGIAGAWLFNERQGTVAYDCSRFRHHLTLTNGPAWEFSTTPRFASGLLFDGSNDYASITPFSTYITASFSLVLWVYRLSRTDDIQDQYWTSHSTSNANYWAAMGGNGSNKLRVALFDGSNNPFADGTTTINLNTWYQLVFIRDVVADKIYAGVNGSIEGSATDTITGSPTITRFAFGGQPDFGSARWVNCVIDHAVFYNRALLPGEVQRLYREPFAWLAHEPRRYWFPTSVSGPRRFLIGRPAGWP